jgi:hypothetical protein
MTSPQHRTAGMPLLDVPRDGVTVVRRLPRPVLLTAVLLFLFMPFLTVSCTSPLGGSVGVEFTGWDSTLGTAPAVHGAEDLGGTLRDSTDTVEKPSLWLLYAIVRTLGGGFLAVVIAGSASLMLLRSAAARSIVAAAGAVLAAGLITANHVVLRAYVDASLTEADRRSGEPGFPDIPIGQFFDVHTRPGLAVTLMYLTLFAVANVAWLAFRLYGANLLAAPTGRATTGLAGGGSSPPTLPTVS